MKNEIGKIFGDLILKELGVDRLSGLVDPIRWLTLLVTSKWVEHYGLSPKVNISNNDRFYELSTLRANTGINLFIKNHVGFLLFIALLMSFLNTRNIWGLFLLCLVICHFLIQPLNHWFQMIIIVRVKGGTTKDINHRCHHQ